MSSKSSRPPSLIDPIEEPELELEDLQPLHISQDLPKKPEHQQEILEEELGFEPASVPSVPPAQVSAPALEMSVETATLSHTARSDEPYEAPQAPLFPPRGAWGAKQRERSRIKLVRGSSKKIGASQHNPLMIDGEDGRRTALAPRAHPSAALLDPEIKGQRKRPIQNAHAQTSSPIRVSPEQLDDDAAAALAALEVELAQTLRQLEDRDGGSVDATPTLHVASWSEHTQDIRSSSQMRFEFQVIPDLTLPDIFKVLKPHPDPESLIGEGVARTIDLSALPQAQMRTELDQFFHPDHDPLSAPQVQEEPQLISSRAPHQPPRDVRVGERVGEDAWILESLLNKINGVQTWFARGASGEGAIIKLAWPELLSESPMSWIFDAELRLKSLQTLSKGVAQQPIAWGDEPQLGCWHVILEWVAGQSVAEMTKRNPLSESQSRDLFARLAEGLATLHTQGVVHRKIQPSHIILSPEGPRLISFQWVDEVEGEDIQRKHQGAYQALKARPILLAPEWMDEGQITNAADVYALAASLLVSLNPDAQGWPDGPRSLRMALSHAMHPDPEHRSTARQFARDLRLSARRYLYRGGEDASQMVERLYLADLIERILLDELGWHKAMREGSMGEGEQPELVPWGQLDEVKEAVERTRTLRRAEKQYDITKGLTSGPTPVLDLMAEQLDQAQFDTLQMEIKNLKEALILSENRINLQEEGLKRQRDELEWQDQALREFDRTLKEREVSIEEEQDRLTVWREDLERQDVSIQERWEEAKAALKVADAEKVRITEVMAKLEAEREALEVAREQAQIEEQAHLELQKQLEAERLEQKERLDALYQSAKEGLLEKEAERLLARKAKEEEARLAAVEAERLEQKRAFVLQLEEEQAAEDARLAELDTYLAELQQEKVARARAKAEEAKPYRVAPAAPKLSTLPSKPGEVWTLELSDDSIHFCYCPAGNGLVGSLEGDGRPEERPQHKVKLTRGFWLSETPITQRQWSKLMMTNPSQFAGGERPVEGVSWLEAISFCNALSDYDGRSRAYFMDGVGVRARVLWDQDANGYRLPTEVEWEYAARCGKEGAHYLYVGGSDLDAVAWYGQNASGETRAVGQKDPNLWGLKDLCGQVWEWCHDEWRLDAYKERAGDLSYDPVLYSPLMGAKVVKGGAWYDFASACRLASRPGQDPETRYGVGLRVMRPV